MDTPSTDNTTRSHTPPPTPDLSVRIYDAINSGSFAVVLVAAIGLIYTKRSLSKLATSPLIANLINLIKQIDDNQEKIEGIVIDMNRLDGSTTDLLEQVAALQEDLQNLGTVSDQQHETIIQELKHIRQQIRANTRDQ